MLPNALVRSLIFKTLSWLAKDAKASLANHGTQVSLSSGVNRVATWPLRRILPI